MSRLRKQKQGIAKTVITMFALLFLILVFIIFGIIFRNSVEKKANQVEDQLSSLETEFALKAFLKAPVDDSKNPVDDYTQDIGNDITNANLIAWTCNNNKMSRDYFALRNSINTFFDAAYGNGWDAEITYSNQELDKKKFGHKGNLLEKSYGQYAISQYMSSPEALTARGREFLKKILEKGFASQVIPCKEGGLAKISMKAESALYSSAKT